MSKITKRTVDALKPLDSRDLFLWDSGDGALKGFGVRVKPSGATAYIIQYRNKEGRTRRLVLGHKGELTPDAARLLAVQKLGDARKGGDPSAERRALRAAISVAELCDLYLIQAKGQIKDSTLAGDLSRIQQHVKPLLGTRAVAGLAQKDIERFQAAVAAGKTARPRPTKGRGGQSSGGRGVASRTVGMLGTILEFAKRQGLITDNPAKGVRRFPDQKRTRFLSFAEIGLLGEAMKAAIAEGENPTGIAAIRALLLSGCRRNEMLALPWAWLDARSRCIRFEDTKSGAQLRPIGTAAANFLASQTRQEGSQWVFPADRGGGHFVGLPRVLKRLCARAGIEDISLHTLRHSFAATAAGLGFSELTIAGLIGHKMPGVTARYAHVPDSALLVAADRVSSRIAAALDDDASAEVLTFTDRRAG